jgi:hypothetical protein
MFHLSGLFHGSFWLVRKKCGSDLPVSPARLPTVALSSQVIDSRPARTIMRHGSFTIVSEQ